MASGSSSSSRKEGTGGRSQSALLSQLRPGVQSRSPLPTLVQQGGRGSQPVSLPKAWCWVSPDQLRVASWPPSSPLPPPQDTPPQGCPSLQPPSSHLGASHLSCQKCFTPCPLRQAPAFRLLPLPTSAKSSAALGPSGVVSSGWWAPSRVQRYPKLIASCPCPSSDNEKSSRAAASLLGNMWQYTKLHRDFKMVRTTPPVTPPAGGILGWIPRVDPKGVEARGFVLESHTTQMLPGVRRAPAPRLPLLKGWGCPQSTVPVVAPAPVGWGQPRAPRGDSVALSVPERSGFVFVFPAPSEARAGVSSGRNGDGAGVRPV